MRLTLPKLQAKVQAGERLAALTAYDATFSFIADAAGIDILLIGDSLGMVCKGEPTTLNVSLDEVIYHTRSVVAGSQRSFILADMPFGSYQESPEQAFRSAARLIAVGAQMVKVEGGIWLEETVRLLTQRGIPTMAHLGLTPQYLHQIGGYKIQGRTEEAASALLTAAQVLEQAGAGAVLLELVPASLAERVTQSLSVPTIGIGAGVQCAGQVLVLHDVLGLYAQKMPEQKSPRFVKNFLEKNGDIQGAIRAYVESVKSGSYPALEHSII
ncbi:MAG: 3-methyl-2-oxobutanoate hydroxymethyltransferase [Pseudomonadota bacterium]